MVKVVVKEMEMVTALAITINMFHDQPWITSCFHKSRITGHPLALTRRSLPSNVPGRMLARGKTLPNILPRRMAPATRDSSTYLCYLT